MCVLSKERFDNSLDFVAETVIVSTDFIDKSSHPSDNGKTDRSTGNSRNSTNRKCQAYFDNLEIKLYDILNELDSHIVEVESKL